MSVPDERFMRLAIDLAVENVRTGQGGPFAAVVVRGGEILATGTNRVTTTSDPTAHAEIVAIREACRIFGTFQLTDCDLYTSCEPCPMCLGAIYWARFSNVFFGATREQAARSGFDDALIYEEIAHPPERRRIPMRRMLPEEAPRPFDEWTQSEHRDPY